MASANENKDFNLPVITINESTDQKPELKSSRKDKSRMNAQFRRTTHAQLLKELGSLLPFPEKVVQQFDYNSILRLVLCYFQMKNLAIQDGDSSKTTSPPSKANSMSLGKMQDLMTEALDGFVVVLLGDGTIVYLSENIQKYLGLSQTEYIGTNVFDIILYEDHRDVKCALQNSEMNSASSPQDGVPCSFFCRMKCPKFKMGMSTSSGISPGFKQMYVSGHFKMDGNKPRMIAVVRPVSPLSVLEIRMEGNMFVIHQKLDGRIIFFDGRLKHLLGYSKSDLEDRLPFDLHHHDDTEPCRRAHHSLLQKGEGMSGYYRFMNKHGQFLWCQTRANMMFDSRSGKPSYLVSMTFIINKMEGDASLAQRAIEAAKKVDIKEDPDVDIPANSRSYDPFPVTTNEWAGKNPFAEDEARSFPKQEDSNSTVKSEESSCSTESLNSSKSYTANPSPQLCDRLSPINQYNEMISPVSKYSDSSLESGYESNISTPPNSVLMRSTGTPSPFFQHDPTPEVVSEQIPTQTKGNTYFKQQPQINFVQGTGQQFQNPFHSTKQSQAPTTDLLAKPTTYFKRNSKQHSLSINQCAGSKRSHQPHQSAGSNISPDLSRNPIPTLSMDVLMASFDDNILPIAPLTELKTEDLDILELPVPSHNVPQTQQSTSWTQYAPNGGQSSVPINHMMPGNRQGNVIMNPLQQQKQRQWQQQQQQQQQLPHL